MKLGILLCSSSGCYASPFEQSELPQNLDFREGASGEELLPWNLLNGNPKAGYTAELRREGCLPSPACAVILPPRSAANGQTPATLTQTVKATMYRGKPVRLRAWLRTEVAGGAAQLWLRVNRPEASKSFFDDQADRPVRASEWTRSEIVLVVGKDAESIDFGVRSLSGGTVWLRDVSIDVVPDSEDSFDSPLLPANLDFADGDVGKQPPAWLLNPLSKGYKAVIAGTDCRTGPRCGVLYGPVQSPNGGYGTLMQTINAAAYRGKTIRLRAWALLQPSTRGDLARVWLQDQKSMIYQEIRETTWTECKIVRAIDPTASTISFGLMVIGSGSARIDGVFVDVMPETERKPASAPRAPEQSQPEALLPAEDTSGLKGRPI